MAAALLAACETPTTQRYSVSVDNNQAIRALGTNGIAVRPFSGPAEFDANCRALGALQVADGLSHAQYIQKAFEAELKMAGAYTEANPRVTIGGTVYKLFFSSSVGVTSGYWDIGVTLDSSNGRKLPVSERYEFNSGFVANEACRNTADAYYRAVQDLVGKAVRDPRFVELVR